MPPDICNDFTSPRRKWFLVSPRPSPPFHKNIIISRCLSLVSWCNLSCSEYFWLLRILFQRTWLRYFQVAFIMRLQYPLHVIWVLTFVRIGVKTGTPTRFFFFKRGCFFLLLFLKLHITILQAFASPDWKWTQSGVPASPAAAAASASASATATATATAADATAPTTEPEW